MILYDEVRRNEQFAKFARIAVLLLFVSYVINGVISPFFHQIGEPYDFIISLFFLQICFLLSVLLPALFIFRSGFYILDVFEMKRLDWSRILSIICFAIFLFPFILLVVILSNHILLKFGIRFKDSLGDILTRQDGISIGVIVFASIFLAPLVEEMSFRLCLFDYLRRFFSGSDFILPCIATSIIFAVLHGEPVRMPGLFLLGIALQYTRYKYKTLLAPIFFHAIHNMLAFFLFFL